MPILTILLLSLGLGLPLHVAAQEQVDRRDASQIADSAAMAGLARDLAADATGDSARAAAIYAWVAASIAWDAGNYRPGQAVVESAEDVFRRRIALCGGFVAIYQRLAREVGLVVQPIEGYAKGFDYVHGQSTKDANHAWLAVSIDGAWRLVDPTWGSGFVADGRFVPSFTWSYFLVPAEELILSHYPDRSRWQLVSQPLGRRDFERMPTVPRNLFAVGFNAAAVRATALTTGVRDFALVGTQQSAVRVLRAPIAGTVPMNALVELELVWPGAADVAMVTGGVWTHLSRSGDHFHGAAPAAAAAIFVVGRSDAGGGEYTTLLHYRVQ
ncbi:hypothetical protein BH23GEM9_BH23GEM9_01860 [soil metagenome]